MESTRRRGGRTSAARSVCRTVDDLARRRRTAIRRFARWRGEPAGRRRGFGRRSGCSRGCRNAQSAVEVGTADCRGCRRGRARSVAASPRRPGRPVPRAASRGRVGRPGITPCPRDRAGHRSPVAAATVFPSGHRHHGPLARHRDVGGVAVASRSLCAASPPSTRSGARGACRPQAARAGWSRRSR